MKVNAPDKLYFFESEPILLARSKKLEGTDIEYTRTDAFIEKSAIWFNNNFIVHDEYGVISDSFDTKEEMFEDFRKYMEGE